MSQQAATATRATGVTKAGEKTHEQYQKERPSGTQLSKRANNQASISLHKLHEKPTKQEKRKQYIQKRRAEYATFLKGLSAHKVVERLQSQKGKVGAALSKRGPGKIEKEWEEEDWQMLFGIVPTCLHDQS